MDHGSGWYEAGRCGQEVVKAWAAVWCFTGLKQALVIAVRRLRACNVVSLQRLGTSIHPTGLSLL
jgi:hypothetical protein